MVTRRVSTRLDVNEDNIKAGEVNGPTRGMILPFLPLSMSFDSINYYVDMPSVRISLPLSIYI